jgi:hypothetical protein
MPEIDPLYFQYALAEFVAGAEAMVKAAYYRPEHVCLYVQPGRRYIRVVKQYDPPNGQRLVHCFVDKTNGDVLKSASWKKPAKYARGNIFDQHNGLNGVTAYGGKYL